MSHLAKAPLRIPRPCPHSAIGETTLHRLPTAIISSHGMCPNVLSQGRA